MSGQTRRVVWGLLLPSLAALAIVFGIHASCRPPNPGGVRGGAATSPPLVLEFTGRERPWPPRMKGIRNVRKVASKPVPGAMTRARLTELRSAALQDPRVRAELGARFAYITGGSALVAKGAPPAKDGPPAAQLTYFSHTHNRAVRVRMSGDRLSAVERIPGYEPPEGSEEIAAAIALARRDPGIPADVRELPGRALTVVPGREQPGHGHRVLYVTFGPREELLPRYFAYVDLIAEKVLAAGPMRRRAGR